LACKIQTPWFIGRFVALSMNVMILFSSWSFQHKLSVAFFCSCFSFYSCLFKLRLKRQITEFKEMSGDYTYITFPAHFRKTQPSTDIHAESQWAVVIILNCI